MARSVLRIVAAVLVLFGCRRDDPEEPCALAIAVRDGVVEAVDGDCARATLAPRTLGDGDLAVSFAVSGDRIVPTVTSAAGGTLRAVVLEGPVFVEGDGPLRWWRQGYQSWSWSGVVEVEPVALDADGLPIVGGDGSALSVAEETASTSWWVGLLGRPGGASLAFGAVSSHRTKVWTATDGADLWVVWGGRGEAIALEAGGSVTLDPGATGPPARTSPREWPPSPRISARPASSRACGWRPTT